MKLPSGYYPDAGVQRRPPQRFTLSGGDSILTAGTDGAATSGDYASNADAAEQL